MIRLATCLLLTAIVLAFLGFAVLANELAVLAVILFGIALISSGILFALAALQVRDKHLVYN
jgi:uncharacterized membrane protein HdeD (DUF308 family)